MRAVRVRPLSIACLVVLAGIAGGCGVASETGSPAVAQPDASTSASAGSAAASAAGSSVERVPLPIAFPALPGAVPAAMPDQDPGLIGLWSTDQRGSAAYDFYVEALPRAGYRIVGPYPGGDVAIIRFSLPDGAIWQVVTLASEDGRVAIEVRLDRP